MAGLALSILQILRQRGSHATAADLQAALGVSQPTVSRALAPLLQSGQVHKVGAARSQRYVLPRTVRGVGSSIPVVRIDGCGQPSPFARLTPLASGAVWVDEADGLSKRFDGLPWFLDDMRPQGFMGRTFAHAHPELQLLPDPRYWSDDDVLRALALCGDDLPGNLVVGEAAFQRFHSLPGRLSKAASPADYKPARAHDRARTRQSLQRNAHQFDTSQWAQVHSDLHLQLSPEQVSGRLKLEGAFSISHECIYRHIYDDKRTGGDLVKHLRCQKVRRKRYASGQERRGTLKNWVSIEQRPAIVDERSQMGDWEGDTIVGKGHQGVVVTLVKRKSHTPWRSNWARATAQG